MTILELCAAALAAMLGVATASARTEKKDSVDDIFNTARQDAILDLGNYSLLQGDVFGAGRGNYSFHRVSLSVRYAFNATKSKYKGKSAGEAAIKRM